MENAKETSAKTLSKNKIKKISEKQILVSDESKNSNFFDNNDISNKPLSRGWYDIASLNLRYIDSKTFNKFCPLEWLQAYSAFSVQSVIYVWLFFCRCDPCPACCFKCLLCIDCL